MHSYKTMELNSIGLLFSVLLLIFGTEGLGDSAAEGLQPDDVQSIQTPTPLILVDISCLSGGMDRQVARLLAEIADDRQDTGNIRIKLKGNPIHTMYRGDEDLLTYQIKKANQQFGHSCFEDTLQYLLEAIDNLSDFVQVVLITDAPSEPNSTYQTMDYLTVVMAARRIRLDVFTSDLCVDMQLPARHKRAIQTFNPYQLLAQATGGTVIHTTKGQINTVASIIKGAVSAAQVTIMKHTYKGARFSNIFFPVDDTMTKFTVRIQTLGGGAPITFLGQPNGAPEKFATGSNRTRKLLSNPPNALFQYEVLINQASDYGKWKIVKMDAEPEWDFTVLGQSEVDFTHEFTEPGPGGYGQYPITGNPIAGKDTKLTVTVPKYDKMKSVDTVLLLDQEGNELRNVTLHNVGGRRGKSLFTATVKIPNKDFQLAIEGQDKSGHTFRRLDPKFTRPVSVDLFVPKSTGTLYINETLQIPYTVTNHGSQQVDVIVDISDNKGFAEFPKKLTETVQPGQNKSGHFIIRGGPVKGVTDTVSISAKPYIKGTTTNPQFAVRRVTVEERPKKPKDKVDPICSIVKMSGKCDVGADLCACVNHTWHMEVEVSDDASGVQLIQPIGVGNNGSFHNNAFTPGQNISVGKIKADVSADCCHNHGAIQVLDVEGNSAECYATFTKNFTAPNPKLCLQLAQNKTINTTIPCNKVDITQKCSVNLGTNNCECHQSTWTVHAEFGSAGYGINNIWTNNGGNSSLTRTNHTADVDVDCCHQQMSITASDVAGNVGRCEAILSKTFKTPSPQDCTTTTSTTSTTTTTTPTTQTTSTTTTKTTIAGTTASKSTSKQSPKLSIRTSTVVTTASRRSSSQNNGTGTSLTTNTPKPSNQKSVVAGSSSTTKKSKHNNPKSGASTAKLSSTVTTTSAVKEEEVTKSLHIPPEGIGGAIVGGLAVIAAVVTAIAVFRKASSKKKIIKPNKVDRRRSESSYTNIRYL